MADAIPHFKIPLIETVLIPQITKLHRLEIGQRIFVPHGERTLPVDLITPRRATLEKPSDSRSFGSLRPTSVSRSRASPIITLGRTAQPVKYVK